MDYKFLRNKMAEAGYELLVDEVRELADIAHELQTLALEPQSVLMDVIDTSTPSGVILLDAVMQEV